MGLVMFHRFFMNTRKSFIEDKGPHAFVARGTENVVGLHRYVGWVKPDFAYEADVWSRKQLGRVDLVLAGSTADL